MTDAVITLKDLMAVARNDADGVSTLGSHDFDEMRALITKPLERTENAWKGNEKYKAMIKNSVWNDAIEKAYERNNISAGSLPDEIKYEGIIVPPKTPMLVGRMLMDIQPMMAPTSQFTVFSKGRKSRRTGRGLRGYQTRSGRPTRKKLVLPDDALENGDGVDQNYLEDIQPGEIIQHWTELYREHREDVSQEFVNTIADDAVGAHTRYKAAGPTTKFMDPSGNEDYVGTQIDKGTWKINTFIDAYVKARTQKWIPDCILTNWMVMGEMLKEESWQNMDEFRNYADFDNATISMILGMKVIVSDQLHDGTGLAAYVFEKGRYARCGMRRDEMVVNNDDPDAMQHSLSISSRFTFAYYDSSRSIKIS